MTTGSSRTPEGGAAAAATPQVPLRILAWLWVGIPMTYGLYELAHKAAQLFTG